MCKTSVDGIDRAVGCRQDKKSAAPEMIDVDLVFLLYSYKLGLWMTFPLLKLKIFRNI